MSAGRQLCGIDCAVVDAQIIQVLEVFHVVACQLRRALCPAACIALFIEILQVCHMAGESPAGAAVHIACAERIKAQFVGTAVDVFRNSFQAFEIGDLVHGMAGFLDQIRISDDAVALIAITDRDQLAVFIVQIVGICIQLVGDRRICQIHRVVSPVFYTGLIADNKQCRRRGLIHFGIQRLAVCTLSSRNDFDIDACRLFVIRCDLLQDLIRFRLEVQPVNGTFFCCTDRNGTCQKARTHNRSQCHGDQFFHVVTPPFHTLHCVAYYVPFRYYLPRGIPRQNRLHASPHADIHASFLLFPQSPSPAG